MPATLKFAPSIPSLCRSRKPYQFFPREVTTINPAATGSLNCSNPTPRGWWTYRILTTSGPPAHFTITYPYPFFNNSNLFLGFPRLEFSGQFSSFSSEESGQGLDSASNSTTIASGLNFRRSPMGTANSADDDCNKDQKYDDGKKPVQLPSSNSAKILTLPTILTIGRVAAVPLLACTFYTDSWWGPAVTTGVFIAAAITDWLDGYLARKMNLGTAFGAFLDPVADKLMVAATLVLLCSRPFEVGFFGQMPWLFTVPAIAIIGREITMSAVREWAASQDGKLSDAVAVNNLGKWKTATQMTSLTILLASRDSSLIGAGSLVASGVVLLYFSAWLSVWSLIVYMRKIWKVLSK